MGKEKRFSFYMDEDIVEQLEKEAIKSRKVNTGWLISEIIKDYFKDPKRKIYKKRGRFIVGIQRISTL